MYAASITPQQATDAYLSGETIDKIATRFEVGRGTVWRRLRSANTQIRRQGGKRAIQSISVPTDPAVLGYIAGMIDGEGTLYVRRVTDRGCSVRVNVYSTTSEVIDWFQSTVGGVVRWDHSRVEKHGWKPMGDWSVTRAADVAALLAAVVPYMIIKRDRARELLALLGREPPS